jgi:IclR family acetate operon transcriptional repressor
MNAYAIPNLTNACRVLQALAAEPEGLLLKELVQGLELPHTSALRIVSTLCAADFLQRNGKKYVLGTGLIPLGQQALARLDIRATARPVLQELSEQTQETAHLAMLSGNHSLLVEVVQSPSPIRIGAPAGTQVELHCTAHGKIFLANQSAETLARLLGPMPLPRRTRATLTTLAELEKEFRRIRTRGYALDNEEYFEGIRCLAAPVHNAQGEVTAAMGITGATTRFTTARIPDMAEQVMAAAAAFSKKLGYRTTTTT